jgi:uncharacterized protein (DUF169 family)
MPDVKDFNHCGKELEEKFLLRTSPIAVKMLQKESDIPKDALRPKKDRKTHYAQCQAFALSRREGMTVAMLKEDHWCPAALLAYGMVPSPQSPDITKMHPYDTFETGKYIGVLTAPLKTASFVPDVVIIYSNSAQLRNILFALGPDAVSQVSGRFFPPSCAHAVVTPMQKGGYWVIIPDPGEFQRALGDEGEMMLAMPGEKALAMCENMGKFKGMGFNYREHNYFMQPDFPRPDFYKKMFKDWGLEDY